MPDFSESGFLIWGPLGAFFLFCLWGLVHLVRWIKPFVARAAEATIELIESLKTTQISLVENAKQQTANSRQQNELIESSHHQLVEIKKAVTKQGEAIDTQGETLQVVAELVAKSPSASESEVTNG